MRKHIYIFAAAALVSCSGNTAVTSLVDPLIGSGGHGHVFVGANVPHGMVAVGPNNDTIGWDWCSGYHDSDSTIAGFAHNHLSGTGIADLGEIVFMPYFDAPSVQKLDKSVETVSPGYYSIMLHDGALKVELTAARRVAFHRYSAFPIGGGSNPINISIDLVSAPKSLMARAGYEGSGIRQIDEYTVAGWRTSDEWARGLTVWFAARFSSPLRSLEGDNKVALCLFDETESLEARVALSYSSEENALANLSAEGGTDFDKAHEQALSAWEESLSSISFKGISPQTDTLFYTSLYHTAFAPQIFSDAGHEDEYTIFSTWDTYRAAHPLYTIIDDRAGDYVNSMLSIAENLGRLPVWHLAGVETDCMVGVHSVPVIADAALKGVRGVDPQRALAQVRKFASQPVEGLEYVDAGGWLPADKVNWSVSRALEYCIDDHAVAALAAFCGDDMAADYYSERARNYRHYFDPLTGYMRGRLSDGTFREPFDPSFSLHMEADYVEGNAWQYTWLVPHDVYGLIALFGGDESFLKQLDALFAADSALNEGASIDITGMIGQFAHGNEPSHHITYLYAYAGQQYKTAEKVRQVCREFYTAAPDGLIGNEDCGQMSAWYVFSALGFYPVNPVAGVYVFGSPLCHEAVIRTASGKSFVVKAENNSEKNIYIQSVTLNGKDYPYSWISHEDIMKGGELVFVMGPEPSDFAADHTHRPEIN